MRQIRIKTMPWSQLFRRSHRYVSWLEINDRTHGKEEKRPLSPPLSLVIVCLRPSTSLVTCLVLVPYTLLSLRKLFTTKCIFLESICHQSVLCSKQNDIPSYQSHPPSLFQSRIYHRQIHILRLRLILIWWSVVLAPFCKWIILIPRLETSQLGTRGVRGGRTFFFRCTISWGCRASFGLMSSWFIDSFPLCRKFARNTMKSARLHHHSRGRLRLEDCPVATPNPSSPNAQTENLR